MEHTKERPGPDRLLTWAVLDPVVPYTRQHVGRLERVGKFPRRVQVGPGRVAWREREIRAWFDALPRGPLPKQSAESAVDALEDDVDDEGNGDDDEDDGEDDGEDDEDDDEGDAEAGTDADGCA